VSLLLIAGWIAGFYLILNFDFLPFSNPLHAHGPFVDIRYNPNNDIVKFLILVMAPSVLFVIGYFLFPRATKRFLLFDIKKAERPQIIKSKLRIPVNIFGFLLVILLIFNLYPYEYHLGDNLDPFHEGETLAATVNELHGLIPYKENLFVHGYFQDVGKTLLAFNFFGRSIGATRTMESLLMMINYFFLFLIMLLLFRKDMIYSLLVFLFLIFINTRPIADLYFRYFNILLIRDFVVLLFVLVVYFLNKRLETATKDFITGVLIFIFSFWPVFSFAISIDRGFFTTAAMMIISVFFLIKSYKKGLFPFFVTVWAAGIAISIFSVYLIMGEGFESFIRFTFLEMPRYKELFDGIKYSFNSITFAFYPLIFSIGFFRMTYIFIYKRITKNNSLYAFFDDYFIEIVLYVLAVLSFRSVLGRSEEVHLAYSSIFFFLWFFYTSYHSVFSFIINQSFQKFYLKFSVFFLGGVFVFYLLATNYGNQLEYRFPVKKTDSEFYPSKQIDFIKYFEKKVKNQEGFYNITFDIIFYYVFDKPSPSRFPILWIAATDEYQLQVINDLEKKKVKYIVCFNDLPERVISGDFDIVFDYFHSNYEMEKKFKHYSLYVRKID
jgi:hypothetical protein